MSAERKREFIDFMLESNVLTFGDFVTKSGRNTPYFLNTGRYTTGSQLRRLGGYYADVIAEVFGKQVNNLFGPAYKGIPLVVTTSGQMVERHQHDVSITFNRKEAKDHGEGGSLVGDDYSNPPPGGYRIVLVEDVTTAGTSIRETMPMIKARPDTEVVGLVVSVDRMERGTGERSALAELEEAYGFVAAPIVNLEDLLEYLRDKRDAGAPVISDEHYGKMMKYYETYGGK
jgi:orotate phosphoribosyltransferase